MVENVSSLADGETCVSFFAHFWWHFPCLRYYQIHE